MTKTTLASGLRIPGDGCASGESSRECEGKEQARGRKTEGISISWLALLRSHPRDVAVWSDFDSTLLESVADCSGESAVLYRTAGSNSLRIQAKAEKWGEGKRC